MPITEGRTYLLTTDMFRSIRDLGKRAAPSSSCFFQL
jgi:hypothetical protein